jgi:hypothetical protein
MSAEETVARWRADEAAVRARLAASPGYARPDDQIDGRKGIEVLEAIFAGELPRPPIGDTLDFVPIHSWPGRISRQPSVEALQPPRHRS